MQKRRIQGHWWLLALSVALLMSVPFIDRVISPSSKPFAISDFSNVLSLLVTVFLVDTWAKARQARSQRRQFHDLSKIAYRTLSQIANDISRKLIGPVAGIDLFAAGIPGVTEREVEIYLTRLKNQGIASQKALSGYWGAVDISMLESNLTVLVSDPAFANEMFRVSSKCRRDLQSAYAEWAPVMALDADANLKLQQGWLLADNLITLAESWRTISVLQDADANFEFELSLVCANYRRVVEISRQWIQDLLPHAEIPTLGSHTNKFDTNPGKFKA
jgi:hypothetical protein